MTFRYLLRPSAVKGDPDQLGYSPQDVGFYETDECFDDAAPLGREVVGRDGKYIVVGKAERDVPDLVRGILFVRRIG